MYPTHYTGEPHYFSDTEDSTVIEKGAVHEDTAEGGVLTESKMTRPDGAERRMEEGFVLEGSVGKDEL